MFLYIRYVAWSWLKVRLRFYWWIIKYGGKKNIPVEVVFGAMASSIGRLVDDLENAERVSSGNEPEAERRRLGQALEQARELERRFNRMRYESQTVDKNL